MVKCEACGLDVGRSDSCRSARVSTVAAYARGLWFVPWWSWRRWLLLLPERCRGCGVAEDGVHHVGCVVAWCTQCHEQRVGCGCDAVVDAAGADCWACERALPHVHRGGGDCPHEPASGEPAACCADYRARQVELTSLSFALKTGRSSVPDTPAGLGAVDDEGK